MTEKEKVNILLVDDQAGKLLTYETILADLDENLLKARSAQEALHLLLKHEVAVVLVDVAMPELDGFELAAMIRQHPRYERTAIIFISAIHLADTDHLRGYEMGAVDYVPVPVVPDVLRAKVRVFAELYRKTRELERLNQELERRVAERTAALEATNARLRESESRRTLALAAGRMGAWDWEIETGKCIWDPGQYRIFGVDPEGFDPTFENIAPLIHPEDLERIKAEIAQSPDKTSFQVEARIIRPSGEMRWCICAAATTADAKGRPVRVSGVTIDITDRKEAEERQMLLAREVDHRARNALAVVQAIIRLTRADSMEDYLAAVEGRIGALAQAHTLLSNARWQGADLARLIGEELAPYSSGDGPKVRLDGPSMLIPPDRAQIVGLALHELATNSAKYGALSSGTGELSVSWEVTRDVVWLRWVERGGPAVKEPSRHGFGSKILNGSIKRQLGGDVEMDWHREGLRCTLIVPCGANGPEQQSADDDAELSPGSLPPDGRRRVLLAEDEVLVGMMMRDLLLELGFAVIGPLRTVAEALTVIDQPFDCAILDVNLAGENVYPIADLLSEREVPLIFVSGYGPESVDKRFADIPVIQKPVALDALAGALQQQFPGGANVAPRSAPMARAS